MKMISVIVPIYNTVIYLYQCINSILNQSYSNLEILLIDDGLTVDCGSICDDYVIQDKRVKVFHTANRGLSAVRNLGIKESKGDYISFVDSDDWIDSEMLEILMKRIIETGADVCVCGFSYEYKNDSVEKPCVQTIYNSKEAINALISGVLRNQVINKLWSRDAALLLDFYEGHVYEDIYSVYKVLNRVKRVATVSKTLYKYRQRKASIARSYPMNYLIDYWKAIYSRYCNIGDSIGANCEKDLLKQCASAIARTWRWFYGVPNTERDYIHLKELHSFSLNNLPLFGKRDWPFALNYFVFLSHSKSSFSLGLAYFVNKFLWNMKFGHRLWV